MIDDVSHPLPGKMGRPRVKFFYFFFRQPQLLPDPDGDPLRGNQSQGHVDAVQSHPVYFLFPAFPGPVGHRVSIGDHIEIIVVAERRNDAARRGVRQLCRPANVLVFPGYHSQTVRFQKIIESPAKGCAAASPDRQHSSGGFRLENIISVFFFNGFQVQFFRGGGQRRHGPHDDCAGGFPFPVFLHVFREYMQACHHQKDQNSGKGGDHARKYAGRVIVLSGDGNGSSAESGPMKRPLHVNMQGPWLKSLKAFIPPWVSAAFSCAALWAWLVFCP